MCGLHPQGVAGIPKKKLCGGTQYAPAVGPRAGRTTRCSWREGRFAQRLLCRDLCRNPAIPTRIEPCRSLSLGCTCGAGKRRLARMNAAPGYHSGFFGVASSRTGSRFDTVEVAGSSPVVPTIFPLCLCGLPWVSRSVFHQHRLTTFLLHFQIVAGASDPASHEINRHGPEVRPQPA